MNQSHVPREELSPTDASLTKMMIDHLRHGKSLRKEFFKRVGSFEEKALAQVMAQVLEKYTTLSTQTGEEYLTPLYDTAVEAIAITDFPPDIQVRIQNDVDYLVSCFIKDLTKAWEETLQKLKDEFNKLRKANEAEAVKNSLEELFLEDVIKTMKSS